MQLKDIHYLAFLSHFISFGQKRLSILNNNFSNWQSVYEASASDLINAGISQKVAKDFLDFKSSTDIYYTTEKLKSEEIELVMLKSSKYPLNLAEIYDPPILLYARGNTKLLNTDAVSVVGSRKLSPYGQKVTYNICSELADKGICIISGLALGIDSIAHQAALDARGKTIAVLGTGVDKSGVYPSSNRTLSENIIKKGGLLLSEFPPGTTPNKFNFPLRNRIIAGLSAGTLVIEAAEKSGALITAQSALDNNREVFAVPGNIYSPVSMGPNKLIKDGAHPVTSTEDILNILDIKANYSYIKNNKIEGDNEIEKKIISVLAADPLHIDEIVRTSKLDTKTVSSAITIMEVKGFIKNYGGNKYSLK